MSIKNKLLLGIVSGVIGLAFMSGATFAYFSDTEVTTNKVVAGTLDLGIVTEEDGIIFEFENKQPGDTFDYEFKLVNDGTLDIGEVNLFSSHEIYSRDGELIHNDFGSQIIVKDFSINGEIILDGTDEITLDDLTDNELLLIENFEITNVADIYVHFEFIDEGDQNQYQGNSLILEWTFEAIQTDGSDE